MQKNISRYNSQPTAKRLPLVTQEGNDGYKQVFPYQQSLIGRILWTGRDSVVRICPGNDGKDFFPQVINTDIWAQDADQDQYLSDTFYVVSVCDHFGEAGMDIVSALRPNSDEWERYPDSPLNYFCNSVHRAVRAVSTGKKTRLKVQDIWRSWTSLGGTLPYPKQALFFQAVCQVINGTPCKNSFEEDAEEAPLFAVIGITHKKSIEELKAALINPMDRRKPIGTANNTFGSLAELEGNWLYLNTSVDEKGRKYLCPSVQSSDTPSNQWNPTEMNFQPEEATALWIPWDKVFNYLSVKEQVDLLCSEFGTDTVQYVLSQDKIWDDLQFNTKVSMATAKTPAKPAVKPSGLSALTKKVPAKPVQHEPEEAEEAPEEPTWESPGRASVTANPALAATVAKIKAQVGGGKSNKGSLAQDMLNGVDLENLDL